LREINIYPLLRWLSKIYSGDFNMATSQARASTLSKNATPPRRPSRDAIALLKADHADVKKCFKNYQKLVNKNASATERKSLAAEICHMLTVHSQIEEEIFYPASRELLGDDADLVDEADVEHASAKELIAQIESGKPDDMHFDAKVKVLGEYIDHHVKEEQDELFPKVKDAGMDTKTIGQELAARKAELMGQKMQKMS
jgi:hemerythrin superfamily protein